MREIFQLFVTFLKIGTFTFGGGYAMIPAIRKETVEKRGWIDEESISDYMAISQSLPGAFSINISIFIGKKVKGNLGAIIACLGLVLPAYLAIILILVFLGRIEENIYVLGAFKGITAASVALILVTAIDLGREILKSKLTWLIAFISFVSIAFFSINAVYVILASGILGYGHYGFRKIKAKRKGEGDQ